MRNKSSEPIRLLLFLSDLSLENKGTIAAGRGFLVLHVSFLSSRGGKRTIFHYLFEEAVS